MSWPFSACWHYSSLNSNLKMYKSRLLQGLRFASGGIFFRCTTEKTNTDIVLLVVFRYNFSRQRKQKPSTKTAKEEHNDRTRKNRIYKGIYR